MPSVRSRAAIRSLRPQPDYILRQVPKALTLTSEACVQLSAARRYRRTLASDDIFRESDDIFQCEHRISKAGTGPHGPDISPICHRHDLVGELLVRWSASASLYIGAPPAYYGPHCLAEAPLVV